ncbi:hypothetical protein EDD30_7500 [Couchioplanes caeruleus]|uniref:Uncharacterized protein n=1 Tax=Couchioplanes caeruleus TaxID=56438 RepID=A0A3N1GVW0_9ACTN|nr:hypothetical protein EDD30_7500 [Couchioplanes caeruleus]
MTALLIAQVAADPAHPAAASADLLLAAFLDQAGGDAPARLTDAVSRRRADPNVTTDEVRRLDAAAERGRGLVRRPGASRSNPHRQPAGPRPADAGMSPGTRATRPHGHRDPRLDRPGFCEPGEPGVQQGGVVATSSKASASLAKPTSMTTGPGSFAGSARSGPGGGGGLRLRACRSVRNLLAVGEPWTSRTARSICGLSWPCSALSSARGWPSCCSGEGGRCPGGCWSRGRWSPPVMPWWCSCGGGLGHGRRADDTTHSLSSRVLPLLSAIWR